MKIRQLAVDSPEETARRVAEWRAAGILPPRGKSAGYVARQKPTTTTSTLTVDTRCDLRGDVTHYEPCTCGSASKIAVHECQATENARKSGASGLCVATSMDLKKVKDKDARATLLCCETCPLRTKATGDQKATQQPGESQ